jgi:hypothetical protein
MSRRRGAAVVPIVIGSLLVGACGGGGREVAAPAPQDLCAQFNSFQVFNFTAKSGAPVPPDQYEVFYRGLVDSASKLAQSKPELRHILDIVMNGAIARANGRPVPSPDLGEPNFESADATLSSYQRQLCP